MADDQARAARRILSLDEVSSMTHVPKNTLRYWRSNAPEKGPNLFKLSGRSLVAWEDEVIEWMETRYRQTSSHRTAV